MSKNGKLRMTPKAKEAVERFSLKAFTKALRLNKFGPQIETQIADLCHEAWAAGYFYAKQESELKAIQVVGCKMKCEDCEFYHQNDPDYPDNCEYPDNPPCYYET